MSNIEKFISTINEGYTFKGESIVLGTGILDNQAQEKLLITAPLKTFNRHGLISGATGTGKTKTLQMIAESLSEKGVPTLLMDIKGDLSGISHKGTKDARIDERHAKIGKLWKETSYPVDFLSLSEQSGVKLRATVVEFGPVLFSKLLELNETQSSIVSIIFKYCDDNGLALLDLKDFKKALNYLSNEGKEEIEKDYGKLNTTSAGLILRKIVELEQQGADKFFGELSFDTEDLLRIDENGKGYIHVLRVNDIQDKPKLFSTFMLSLLSEIYQKFPEEGDLDAPKLVMFIDEAHLIFNEASKTLLNQIETIIKLIRSKGVGIFFCTQSPSDIPDAVLGQLGMKVQHALRAFTAKDRKDIKLASENYPNTEFYKVNELITNLGIGEAFITVLNEKGIPTPLVHSLLCAPQSRMSSITDEEKNKIVNASSLVKKYSKMIDEESAYEILSAKIEKKIADQEEVEDKKTNSTAKKSKPEKSVVESITGNPMAKQVGRTVARELTRGLLGALFGGSSKKKSSSSWF